jgi:hypothetical protein
MGDPGGAEKGWLEFLDSGLFAEAPDQPDDGVHFKRDMIASGGPLYVMADKDQDGTFRVSGIIGSPLGEVRGTEGKADGSSMMQTLE